MSVLLLTMGPQLGIAADLPVVAVGGAGVIRFRPIGATGQVKWTLVDSTLPAEWDSALNPDGNDVTLTTADAETAGTFSVTVRALDSARIPVVRSFDVRVMALPLTIFGAFPEWEVGVPATGALTISGGVPPYSGLSIISGELPAGVSLSIVGNQIVPSGTPTVTGPWSATLQVSDSEFTPALLGIAGSVKKATDPYWDDVSVLLNMEGPNGGTTFIDSTGLRTWVTSGSAAISNELGYNALKMYNPTPGYISTPYVDADMDWWTEDFTIEAWIYAESFGTWDRYGIAMYIPVMAGNLNASSTLNYWSFGPVRSGKLSFYYYNGAEQQVLSSANIPTGELVHIAMCKTSSGIRLCIGGNVQAPVAVIGTPLSGTETGLTIGRHFNQTPTGFIKAYRITKGVARYTSNFIPPDAPFLGG